MQQTPDTVESDAATDSPGTTDGASGAIPHERQASYDVVIVGGGPAGSSTALNLAANSPEIAARTLVIDAAHHPRTKICGGGLTGASQRFINSLGLQVDVPFQPVHELAFRFRGQEFRLVRPYSIMVVRRDEFDAAVLAQVRERGVEVREGVALRGLTLPDSPREPVTLHTSEGDIRARVVVGADGAKSVVRRYVEPGKRIQYGSEAPGEAPPERDRRVTRAIEVLTPEDPNRSEEFTRGVAVFDFSHVPDGLQGYTWDFPSLVAGEPCMNRGTCDFRVYPDRDLAPMKEFFRDYLHEKEIDLDQHRLLGNPSRHYDPSAVLSAPGIVLVGDAAGVEPLVGDGIACSFWYGQVAAREIAQAFERGDFCFADYSSRLASSELGQFLTARVRQARFLYSRRPPLVMHALWVVFGVVLPRRNRRVSLA